jgi:hypothetical protein
MDICDICEEKTPCLHRHPWKKHLMICYECRVEALADQIDYEYERMRDKIFYVDTEVSQVVEN